MASRSLGTLTIDILAKTGLLEQGMDKAGRAADAMKRYRRRSTRSDTITPAARTAYRAGDRNALRRELHLKPWQPTPLEVDGRCPWPDGTAGAKAWPASVALRAALET